MIRLLLSLFILCLLSACSTAPFKGQKAYEARIDSSSAGDKQFSGLYDNFEFRATLLTENILQTINDREALIYGWDTETTAKELQKKLTASSDKTRLFMSFFTPRGKDDNLSTSSTIWKLYLHNNGQRYEGKVKKTKYNLTETIALYPYHSRWTTAYIVEFPARTDVISGDVRFEITGPLGRREVAFGSKATE